MRIFSLKSFKKESVSPTQGFTFLELIIVIFIISLIMAVVFPSFYGPGSSEKAIASEAKKLASILRYLNDLAISSKEPAQINIDLDTSTVSWKSYEGVKSDVFRGISGVMLPSKGTVREGQLIVFFNPLGAEEDISIFLRDGQSHFNVLLNHFTGRVRITKEDV